MDAIAQQSVEQPVTLPPGARQRVGYKIAAAILGIPEGSVRRMVSTGEGGLPFYRPTPRVVCFDVEELEAWLQASKGRPAPARTRRSAEGSR